MTNAVTNNILKPLRVYFKDDIKEVVMNKPCEIQCENTSGEWITKTDKNLNYTWFKSFATVMSAMTGQKFNSGTTLLSFKLPEGHRVQIIHGDKNTKNKFCMAVRLFRSKIFSLLDYEITSSDRNKIITAVKNQKTILISGGTSTGKTSFLNTLINIYVEKDSRIITIEGVPELIINDHKNLVPMYYSESKDHSNNKHYESSDFLNASLRMRPDRIILGELRKENAFVFIRAINTGHEGSMATIHANTPEDALSAVAENVILNGDAVEGSLNILESQLKRNIFGVIQLNRIKGGGVRGYFKEMGS